MIATLFKWLGIESTFKGCYKSFSEISGATGFTDAFAKHRVDTAFKCYPTLQTTALLPIVVSRYSRVTVLDFGGGPAKGLREIYGMTYGTDVRYILVELPSFCREVKRFCPIESLEKIPDKIDSPCIVNANSSLQYIEQWRSTLSKFASLAPDCIIIGNTPVSNHPTYARVQANGFNRRIPTWVFNISELKSVMENDGYHLIYKYIHPEKYRHRGAPAASWYSSMIFMPVTETINA